MPLSPAHPHRHGPARRLALAALLTAATTLLATPSTGAAATGPVYEGRGWRINTVKGIYSLSPDPYEIVFADTTARTRLTPYLTRPAAQITAITGVQVTVTTLIDTTPRDQCPPRHRIVVHYTHQPMGVAGYSQAYPCYANANNSAWGGHVLMDSEYWEQPNWFSTDPVINEGYRKNLVTHELGHVIGLDHPNYDQDGDGQVEPYECVTTASGTRPTVCSRNGGYLNAVDAGKFTPPFDEPGLKQLAANYYLRQST
jgi:hypothetical protein